MNGARRSIGPPLVSLKLIEGNEPGIPSLAVIAESRHTVRVATIDNEPWFVAKDVCEILGIVNTANAIRPLGDAETRTVGRSFSVHLFYSGRGTPKLTLISESGLYKLVRRSDKPQAKEFQNWVTKVVLPAIREDGGEGRTEG